MAFFKFRQRGQPQPEARRRGDAPAATEPQETIDSMRRRARHRLVGAAVLVLVAVIGFPLLFDTQPRPVVVDAPITIPDKDKLPPLRAPGESVSTRASLDDKEEVLTPTAPRTTAAQPAAAPAAPPAVAAKPAAPAPEARPAPAEPPARAAAKPDTRADEARAAEEAARAKREQEAQARAKREQEAEARAKREQEAEARAKREQESQAKREQDAQKRDQEAEARAKREQETQAKREQEAQAKREQEARARREAEETKRQEAARARAILEGRGASANAAAAPAATDSGRFILQLGAFAEADKAREVRQQAERAGVKTYVQVVDTPQGKRTRVRVGPYPSRAEAEKAAAALKKAGLAGSILSL